MKNCASNGLYYYGARYYDPRISLWLSTDPLQEKYPNISTYAYCVNNPVKFVDLDGKDIVFMGLNGTEIHRIKSDSEFKTFITNNSGQPTAIKNFTNQGAVGWVEVPMPNIIQTRPATSEDVSGKAYQENDYSIAAETGYFNQAKNASTLKLYTEGGNLLPDDAIKSIPDLDPTLVKAISIQESHGGPGKTKITDIMQVNVKGDWSSLKSKYSLEKGVIPTVFESISAGVKVLGSKGFKGGVTYDKKTGESTYTFKGWNHATDAYNGGGVKNYSKDVKKMVDNSKKPTTSDY